MYSYYIISSNIFILLLHKAYILLPELNVAYLMHIGCLRAKGFNVLYPVARYHPIGFKCKIVGSGNILEALNNGLRSDGLMQWISSTFPHSILMTWVYTPIIIISHCSMILFKICHKFCYMGCLGCDKY